jgi:signal transduction histidine kinase
MPPLLASLRSRVFTAMAIVAVLPIAVATVVVTRRLTTQAEADLGRGLEEAARLVVQYHQTRLDTAKERAALVADLPKLKAAVATADPPTIEPLARDYRSRVRADVFVVADGEGRTLVALGADLRSWTAPSAPVEFRPEAGRLLETVSVPILLGAEAPERLGLLTLGFAIDDAFAAHLRALTGSHVAIVRDGRVFSSTLPRSHDATLVSAGGAGLAVVELGGEDWVAERARLGPEPGWPVALVLRSRAEALRPLRTLRAALALAALAAVAVSLILSWALARTVTRPLAALTDAMRQIAATGDLAPRIGPGRPWDDEDARLVARTFGALTDSIARFQREAALRERLSALGRLSTVVAHEVRNPLMIIKGSLRALRRDGAAADEIREAAGDIDHEVARLDRIVGDVLDFARPLTVETGTVDAGSLAREATRAALEGAADVVVRFDLEPSAVPVVTDGDRLRSVLLNLVGNARDSVLARRRRETTARGVAPHAGAEGRAAADIEVGIRRPAPGRLLIWVGDRGDGIAAGDLPHVFEPYYTTKRTGTGLGLAIARKVIEALGGTIRLDSRPGEGTRAEIELPEALAPGGGEAP